MLGQVDYIRHLLDYDYTRCHNISEKKRMRLALLALLAPVRAEELGRIGCGRRSGEGEPAGRVIRVSMRSDESFAVLHGSTKTVKNDWQIQRQIAKVSKSQQCTREEHEDIGSS